MIDLHNHFLPGLDDGARDMGEALAMARLAVADGITHLVCTPHIRPGLYDNDWPGIQAALGDYRQALEHAEIELAVSAAAEVHFGLDILDKAKRRALPLLGEWDDRPVVLLEFPHAEVPFGAARLTEWLISHDILPMIAHPERNRDLMHDPKRLLPFLDQGCLMQITAGALLGQFGERSQAFAEHLVGEGVVTCVASDAHNTDRRLPGLSRAAEAITALQGPMVAHALVVENPWRIACGHFSD